MKNLVINVVLYSYVGTEKSLFLDMNLKCKDNADWERKYKTLIAPFYAELGDYVECISTLVDAEGYTLKRSRTECNCCGNDTWGDWGILIDNEMHYDLYFGVNGIGYDVTEFIIKKC